jgi:hypothetical protein
MRAGIGFIATGTVAAACLGAWLLVPRLAAAHCDTLDGPVVAAARQALDKGDVTPVLKWIKPEHEAQVKTQFEKTLALRKLGPEARDLADMYFFETLVRLHRAGEGAPYTGLLPSGTDPGAAVRAADKALESGSPDELIKLMTDAAAAGIRQRFEHARHAREKADASVAEGRQYVAAYVEFVHFAERLYDDTQTPAHAHDAPAAEHAGHAGDGDAHGADKPDEHKHE